MSDGLTSTSIHESLSAQPERPVWPLWKVALAQGLAVIAVFAVVGALGGLLWYWLWDVPQGVVSGYEWYTSESGLRDDFAGTGWYVAISVLAGLLLGALAAWLLDRFELVTLVAVVGGSVLAAYLMLRVGYHLSPPDPHQLARTAADGTRLDGAMRVDSWPPKGAFTFGAVLGLALVYASTLGQNPPELRTEPGDGPSREG
jgi:hypothetical protein